MQNQTALNDQIINALAETNQCPRWTTKSGTCVYDNDKPCACRTLFVGLAPAVDLILNLGKIEGLKIASQLTLEEKVDENEDSDPTDVSYNAACHHIHDSIQEQIANLTAVAENHPETISPVENKELSGPVLI